MNCPNCGMKLGNADTRCRVCGAAVPYARSGGFEPDADTRYNPYGPGDSSPSAQIKGTALRGAGVYSSSAGAAASDDAFAQVSRGEGGDYAAPVSAPVQAAPGQKQAGKRSRRKQSPLRTVAVVLLALAVLAAAVYLPYRFLYLPYKQSRPLTRTEVLERYLQAVLEKDPQTAFSYTPFAGDRDMYAIFTRDVLADDGGAAKRQMEDSYGRYTVKVQIDETEEYAKEALDRILTVFSLNYHFGGYRLADILNTDSVAELVQVKGTLTVKGRKGSDSMPFTATMILYDDRWKILDSSMTKSYPQMDISKLLP